VKNHKHFGGLKIIFQTQKISEKSARYSNGACIRGGLIVPDSESLAITKNMSDAALTVTKIKVEVYDD